MQAFWFGTIMVLWAGFFLLEGFDFGVGMLMPFVARDETDRKVVSRTIGPVWDGNEVWLLIAGGATFAAFPEWYASLFAGFYLAFALLLAGLIVRGIGIEYRTKVHTARGRAWCDGAFIVGSFLPALLVGVAFADFLRGVDMNSAHDVTSGFFSLLTPFALLGGVTTLLLFAFHGAVYLQLRTEGPVRDRAQALAPGLGGASFAAAVALVSWAARLRGNWVAASIGVVILIAIGAGVARAVRGHDATAFAATALATLLVPVWAFASLWPDVLPARNNSAFSLTVHNASSSHYTLVVMTVVALVMTPIVLAYETWSYWVFRARVTGTDVGDGYGGAGRLIASAKESAATTLGRHAAGAARGPLDVDAGEAAHPAPEQ